MQNVIINVIIWVTVSWIVSMLGNSAISNLKEGKISIKELSKDNSYIIQYPTFIKVIIVIALLLGLCFFLAPLLTYLGICVMGTGAEAWVVILFGGLELLCLYAFSGIVIWRIIIEDNLIIYRNYLGITHKYNFSDITKIIEKKNGKVLVYINKKKIFSLDDNVPEIYSFICTAQEKGIEVESYA